MTRLDTHAVVWLAMGDFGKFSKKVVDMIEKTDLCISPIVQLELTYLNEIGRLSEPGTEVIRKLRKEIGLTISSTDFIDVIDSAESLVWTRDHFDRMIVADAMFSDDYLISKDGLILSKYDKAIW